MKGLVLRAVQALHPICGLALGWSVWGYKLSRMFGLIHGPEWEGTVLDLDEMDVLVDSGRGAASTSLVAYLRRWNPGVRFSDHPHCAGALRAFAGPKIVVVRHLPDTFETRVKHHTIVPSWWVEKASIVMWYAFTPFRRCAVVKFEEITKDARVAVWRLNDKFGLTLNKGDGRLPHVRPPLRTWRTCRMPAGTK